MGWNGGDSWNLSGDRFLMLESTKDRVLGVYTPGQQVPPCIWYGMTCLLIRDVVGSVSYLNEWELA
jgi:hypothetical protein